MRKLFPTLLFRAEPDGVDLTEFRHMVLVWLLLLEGSISVFWQLFESNPLILGLCLGLHVLAIWLAFKNPYLSGMVWAFAISTVTALSIAFYDAPLAIFSLCVMPLFAVMIFGYWTGLLTQGLVVGLALLLPGWLSPGWLSPPNGLIAFTGPVIGGGAVLLVFGGVFRYWFLDTIRVYYENYLYAIHEIEVAREQRVELKQVQEDLIHANRELGRATRQLKLATQAAEEARRAKETFVATVSHELRTPLNMIIGFSEVIGQSPKVYGGKLHPALLADIASIQRNSQHLLELVNDVLDLSQVDMGNLSILRSRCSVETIIAEAFDVIHPLFASKGLFLKAEIQPDLGEVECDQTRIREVIINLLSNAGRFTEQGGVHVRAVRAGSELQVAVQDSGPGIAKEDQHKLFEPFQQLDSSLHRKHGGSGLGLAISKRFVEMHGGKMWLESQTGQGTTFFFCLPLGDTESPGETTLAARWVNPYAAVTARTRPFKAPSTQLVPGCVVLEEGQTASHLFERYLGEVEVVQVDQVDAMLGYLASSTVQLLAINHPEGARIQSELVASNRLPFGLPVVSFWLPGSADMATSLHVRRYLIKPVSKEALLNAIEEIGGQAKKILLVDDNPELLQLFGRILSSSEKKYQVLRASDGQQALEMLRQRRPDVMILDLVMPEFSGLEVLKEKASDSQIAAIPVIIVSAQDPAGAQKITNQVMLAKQGGFSPRDLLELVKNTLY